MSAPGEASSRDRILQKSMELFAERGYEATSVREICEAAGLTKPTLYHFFGSKEGVFRALVEGALAEISTELAAALDAPGPVRARLRAFARLYFERTRARRPLMRLIFSLVHNPPAAGGPIDCTAYYDATAGRVAAVLEQGVASGELRPGPFEPRLLVFMGGLAESLAGNLIAGRPELTPELADALVDTVLDGWTPKPE
ncbi:MAG: TetR/AcrR family transcriptional regulator [Vicinamibacteria bacterium]|nr:TetR/AcrR family transcriptional regulator [Vicinamibacteria bacterium]